MKKLLTLFCFFSIFFFNLPVFSNDLTSVPYNLQTKLFLKTVNYSNNLKDIPKINIGIVFNNNNTKSLKSKDVISFEINRQKSLVKGKSIEVISIEEDSLSNLEENFINVLYFVDHLDNIQNIQSFSKTKNILSWSSDPNYVNQGFASISIFERNKKPRLFINLKNIKKETQSINPTLLKISKVIR